MKVGISVSSLYDQQKADVTNRYHVKFLKNLIDIVVIETTFSSLLHMEWREVLISFLQNLWIH